MREISIYKDVSFSVLGKKECPYISRNSYQTLVKKIGILTKKAQIPKWETLG